VCASRSAFSTNQADIRSSQREKFRVLGRGTFFLRIKIFGLVFCGLFLAEIVFGLVFWAKTFAKSSAVRRRFVFAQNKALGPDGSKLLNYLMLYKS